MHNEKEIKEDFQKNPDVFFEKASMNLLKESLKQTYKERFLAGTRLYKIHRMLKNAKITHKPFINS